MSDNRKYVQAQPFTLAGSGCSVGDSTLVLSSFTDPDGVQLTMADFGTKGFGTVQPGAGIQEEQIVFTGVSVGTSTTTLTGVSNVDFVDPYTETANFAKSHAGGTQFIISNTSGFYGGFLNKANDETITGLWQFPNDANTPVIGASYVAPTLDTQIPSKKYVDDVAVAGAPNAAPTVKGIVQIATNAQMGTATATGSTGALLVPPNSQLVKTSSGAGDVNKIPVLNASGQLAAGFLLIDTPRTWATVQTFPGADLLVTDIANAATQVINQTAAAYNMGVGTSGAAIVAGNPIYLKASDSKLYKTAASADESTFSFVGFAIDAAGAADVSIRYARPGGTITGLTSLTVGSYYFLSDTAGAIAVTPGTRYAKVGQALSTTVLRIIEPKFIVSGTQAITSATTFVQTCGFYPANITLVSRNASGDTAGSSTVTGAGGLYWVANTPHSVYLGSESWRASRVSDDASNTGSVSAKSQTGFTLNCNAWADNHTVNWTAFSL